jgi:hypothetical protein
MATMAASQTRAISRILSREDNNCTAIPTSKRAVYAELIQVGNTTPPESRYSHFFELPVLTGRMQEYYFTPQRNGRMAAIVTAAIWSSL